MKKRFTNWASHFPGRKKKNQVTGGAVPPEQPQNDFVMEPLYFAITQNSLQNARNLFNDPQYKCTLPDNGLPLAIACGSPEMVRLLVEKKGLPENGDILFQTCQCIDPKVVNYIISLPQCQEWLASPGTAKKCFNIAADCGNDSAFIALLKCGAIPSEEALGLASASKNATLRLFAECIASPEKLLNKNPSDDVTYVIAKTFQAMAAHTQDASKKERYLAAANGTLEKIYALPKDKQPELLRNERLRQEKVTATVGYLYRADNGDTRLYDALKSAGTEDTKIVPQELTERIFSFLPKEDLEKLHDALRAPVASEDALRELDALVEEKLGLQPERTVTVGAPSVNPEPVGIHAKAWRDNADLHDACAILDGIIDKKHPSQKLFAERRAQEKHAGLSL